MLGAAGTVGRRRSGASVRCCGLRGASESRRYIKVSEDGAEERTAFEVSAAEVEELPAEVKV